MRASAALWKASFSSGLMSRKSFVVMRSSVSKPLPSFAISLVDRDAPGGDQPRPLLLLLGDVAGESGRRPVVRVQPHRHELLAYRGLLQNLVERARHQV